MVVVSGHQTVRRSSVAVTVLIFARKQSKDIHIRLRGKSKWSVGVTD